MYGELSLIKTTQGGEVPAIPIVIQNPMKVAALRLPTSEEITAYTGSIRQVIHRLGRRQSEDRDVPNQEAERKFFESIRLDKTGDEFDEAEMRHAIDIVLRHSVAGCERDGDTYTVKVNTLWGVTSHTCRIPTTHELQTYREGVIKSRDLPHNVEERRFPPEAPIGFYNAVITAVEGYAPQYNVPAGTVNGNRHVFADAELKAFLPQIPPHHKRSVAGEVSSALYDLDPQLDPKRIEPEEWPWPLPLRLLVYRLLRSEELCRGEDEGASACPVADTMRCVGCGYRWKTEDPSVPGRCPSCDQNASVAERCESCPVVEVEHYRSITSTGQLLDRVLEHEFDTKHYRIDAGDVSSEVREGLKILEQERARWEKEEREKADQERQDQQRVHEMQRRSGRGY